MTNLAGKLVNYNFVASLLWYFGALQNLPLTANKDHQLTTDCKSVHILSSARTCPVLPSVPHLIPELSGNTCGSIIVFHCDTGKNNHNLMLNHSFSQSINILCVLQLQI